MPGVELVAERLQEAGFAVARRELGGARVPAVVYVSPHPLVLEPLRPRGDGERFWEQFGRMFAALHTVVPAEADGGGAVLRRLRAARPTRLTAGGSRRNCCASGTCSAWSRTASTPQEPRASSAR